MFLLPNESKKCAYSSKTGWQKKIWSWQVTTSFGSFWGHFFKLLSGGLLTGPLWEAPQGYFRVLPHPPRAQNRGTDDLKPRGHFDTPQYNYRINYGMPRSSPNRFSKEIKLLTCKRNKKIAWKWNNDSLLLCHTWCIMFGPPGWWHFSSGGFKSGKLYETWDSGTFLHALSIQKGYQAQKWKICCKLLHYR